MNCRHGTVRHLLLLALLPFGAARAARQPAAPVPVLVELFTSEGCSSCPPADELLASLVRDQPVAGAQVIALGEHVDYWNGLGWSDPFSQPLLGRRQAEYVQAWSLAGRYTPQMVVDGVSEFVGSDRRRAIAAIAQGASAPKLPVVVSRVASGTNAIALRIEIPAAAASADLYVAAVENDLGSRVTGGENQGRHLTHAAVVRRLVRVGTVPNSVPYGATVTLPIDRDWKRSDLLAVVFEQDTKSRRVIGVASIPLR